MAFFGQKLNNGKIRFGLLTHSHLKTTVKIHNTHIYTQTHTHTIDHDLLLTEISSLMRLFSQAAAWDLAWFHMHHAVT